jgi:hypothetical protein
LLALSAAFLLCAPPAARADQHTDAIYDGAVAAFHEDRYQDALSAFQQLRALGLDEPALHLNIGSSHYRLQQYEEAETAFLMAARDPALAELSYYNLALSAYRRGDHEMVRRWIRRVQAEPRDETIQALSHTLLGRLDTAGETAISPWNAVLFIETGYNDNVYLLSDDEVLDDAGRGDVFLGAFGRFDYRPGRPRSEGLVLQGGAYLLRHRELREFDTALLHAAAEYERSFDRWLGSAGLHLEQSFLDGRRFNLMAALRLQGSRPLGDRRQLDLAYEIGDITESNSEYSYLSGLRQQLEAAATWRGDAHSFRLLYRLEHNDREDIAAPLFTSYSPVRHELRSDLNARLAPRLAAQLGLQYRHSRYADPNVLADGTRRTRADDRLRLSGRLGYLFAGEYEVSMEIQHDINDSNIAEAEYSQTLYTLSVFVSW